VHTFVRTKQEDFIEFHIFFCFFNKLMRIIFDNFIVGSVRTSVNQQGEVSTYIQGVEVGSFMVSLRIVGKALEIDLKDLQGLPLRIEVSGINFLNREGSVLNIRAEDFKVLDTLQVASFQANN